MHNTKLALACIAASLVQTANAADLSVCLTGCPFATIQSAINSSHSGDVVHIAAGTYFENLSIDGKRLTLLGAGEDLTVIDGRYRGATVTLGTLQENATQTVSIIGVTITHGRSPLGGGISVLGELLDLQNSIVTSNQSTGGGGGIEFVTLGAPLNKITKSMIVHNRAAEVGGGIDVGAEAVVQVVNSTIARNTAGTRGGGLYANGASRTTIQTTTFNDNTSQQNGGGIYLEGGEPNARMTIDTSTFVGNSATLDGGGIFRVGGLSINKTVLAHNLAGNDGGGISAFVDLRAGALALSDVFVVQNSAGSQGGGILNEATLALTNVTIAGNQPNNCVQVNGVGCP